MKRVIIYLYTLLSWFILSVITLISFLFFIVESPSSILELVRTPLGDYNITYGEMEGSLLTGFSLTDMNYKNQAKAKELRLKVDFTQLENRVLYIDNLVLKNAEIERTFLHSLIDVNSTDESNSSEGNFTLPFNQLIVKSAEISLQNTGYDSYFINQADLDVKNLQTDMKEQYQAQIDFTLDSNVTQTSLKIDYKNGEYKVLAKLDGEQLFINRFLKEEKLYLEKNPQVILNIEGDMHFLTYDLSVDNLIVKQNILWVKSKKIVSKGRYNIKKKYLNTKLFTSLDSSIARVNLDVKSQFLLEDINKSLVFDMALNIDTKNQLSQDKFLEKFLFENNLRINQVPKVKLLAKGDMKKSTFSLKIKGLKVKQNEINLNVNNFNLKGEIKALKGDTKIEIDTDILSSVTDIKGSLKSKFNFKDVNNSLLFNTDLALKADASYVNKFLKENNLTLSKDIPLILNAEGSMKKSHFNLKLKNIKGKQKAINFSLPHLTVEGDVKPLDGDVDVQLLTLFTSTVGNGDVDVKSVFNFNDVNNSLFVDAKSKLKLDANYLNSLLKEHKVRLRGAVPLVVEAKGDMKKMLFKLTASARGLVERKKIFLSLHASPLLLHLQNHQIEGELEILSKAKNLRVKVRSDFSGDYLDYKSIKTKSRVDVNNFHAFGVNLNTIVPLHLNVNKGNNGLSINLTSKKIQMRIKSRDLDHLTFILKTGKLYPEKFIEISKELKKKFIRLDLSGEATLSNKYFKLKGLIESNKQFKLHLDAKNNIKGLMASIKGRHLKVLLGGDMKKKDIHANIEIDSIKLLQKELSQLYIFPIVDVDGFLKFDAKVKGEEVWAKVTSPKIKLKGFRIKELNLDAHYKKELLTLNRFQFKTRGFKNKKLNQAFYLNRKGLIHLGKKRDILIDMHPKILFKAEGTQENLKALVQVEELPLGHPNYGDMVLSCDVDYLQKGRKKRIVGGVFVDKLKLHYESSFLDPSSDPDVIIITKKDKKRVKAVGGFEEDVFIDLSIYAKDGRYKTRDIDLTFDVNVKASKKFRETLRMLGKVEDINGRVEQPPKLFTVVDSNIVFKGGKEINPLLDLKVKHELPDVLITIKIHGTPKRPKLDFSSEPPLPKKDILSYLLFGVSTANLAEGEGNIGREAELFIMNQAARDFAYELELDRVFIKDDGTGEGYAIQVGKKINENSMAIVETSKEGNSFILEYDMNENIKVEIGHHQKTIPSQSIDIYFRKRFK